MYDPPGAAVSLAVCGGAHTPPAGGHTNLCGPRFCDGLAASHLPHRSTGRPLGTDRCGRSPPASPPRAESPRRRNRFNEASLPPLGCTSPRLEYTPDTSGQSALTAGTGSVQSSGYLPPEMQAPIVATIKAGTRDRRGVVPRRSWSLPPSASSEFLCHSRPLADGVQALASPPDLRHDTDWHSCQPDGMGPGAARWERDRLSFPEPLSAEARRRRAWHANCPGTLAVAVTNLEGSPK